MCCEWQTVKVHVKVYLIPREACIRWDEGGMPLLSGLVACIKAIVPIVYQRTQNIISVTHITWKSHVGMEMLTLDDDEYIFYIVKPSLETSK